MALSPQHIAQLLYARLNGTLTEGERAELEAWMNAPGRSPMFAIDIDDESVIARWISEYENEQALNGQQLVLERILGQLHAPRVPVTEATRETGNNLAPVRCVSFLQRKWLRYAGAIIITACAATWLWNTTTKEKTPAPVTRTQPSPTQLDIAPGGNRAMLTLADGRQIALDSAANGLLAEQQQSSIIKTAGGKIEYQPIHAPVPGEHPAQYNTMSTPRGGQYQLTLPDGSRVWLNAASSITYPTIFTGQTRTVSITGEAYFEIKPSPRHPFIVETIAGKIEVLGTSFNINSYADEPFVKTSLIAGSVLITPTRQEKGYILRPGQAFINNKIIKTNIDRDLSWKNGYFSFEKTSLQSVMRQLSRWYDVDIIYQGNIPPRTFSGEIGRGLTLGQVLKGLSTTKINYRVESGNRIIILP